MAGKSKNNPEIAEDLVIQVRRQEGFFGLPIVDQGKVAVVLRNGRVDRIINPGRQLMLRLPLQKLETYLVETRVRNLNVVSQGEFLTVDQWRVDVSMWVSYKVIAPARVAVEHAAPVQALYNVVKDLLGRLINQQDFQTLSQHGRQVVQQGVLSGRPQVEELLGITLTDVRVDDLTLPERVGTAFDERRVAQMRGEAEQWQLRGKWQDMPASVQRSHFQEQLVEGSTFVNPPLPGTMMGTGAPSLPQSPPPGALPPGGQIVDGQVARTRMLGSQVWGQLTIVSGPQQGVVFTLHSPVMTVGRAGDNDIVLQDSAASGHHAQIEQPGLLVDLNSSNGTLVNGQRIQKAQLAGSEMIQIGGTHLRFETP